jgi:hypothetical protein
MKNMRLHFHMISNKSITKFKRDRQTDRGVDEERGAEEAVGVCDTAEVQC